MVVFKSSGSVSNARGTSNIVTNRPQNPKQWQQWVDPNNGDSEQWNGFQWTRITRLDHISSQFGLGSDGDVVITGSTTLTSDMFYNSLTITSTGALSTAGYRVFSQGKLLNEGNINVSAAEGRDGGIAHGIPGGTAGAAGVKKEGYLIGAQSGGIGGGGAAGTANPGAGGGSSTNSLGDATVGGNGGSGGNGDAGSGGAGGTGGTVTAAAANVGSIEDPSQAISYRTQPSGSSGSSFGSGGGGGGGGGGRGSHFPSSGVPPGGGGGGGGASAHSAVIVASILSGSGTLTGIGGDGGNGGNGSAGNEGIEDTGGGGGGGGAQGAFVFLIFSRKENYNWTVTLTGGIGGLGGAPNDAGGAGTDGADGDDGTLYEYSFE